MTTAPNAIPRSVNGWSPEYLEARYRLYKADPTALSQAEQMFFAGFELAMAGDLKIHGVDGGHATRNGSANGAASVAKLAAPSHDAGVWPSASPLRSSTAPIRVTPFVGQPAGQASHFQAVVDDFITAYRTNGHLVARIDPFDRARERPEDLTFEYHELTDEDLRRPVDAGAVGHDGAMSLRDLVDRLERTYCGSIGAEFMHVTDTDARAWLLERFERTGGRYELTRGEKAHLLEQLTRAEMFERFLGKRYPGEKRFSLEGSESLIPLLDRLIETASRLGIEEIVLGMAHRGRLNVLNNILGKTYQQMFTEFEETWLEDFDDSGGDVKYHRGYSGTRRFPNGRMLHLAMASNPSHLECVGAVVQGRCRAKQRLRADLERKRVVPVVIHGDAAVAGQGIVAEILNFSQLEGYTTGGTVHIVVNNQIGFTTVPEDARSSRYCTDVAKMIEAPILHVNGEDPEAVVITAAFAMEFRQTFKRDIFIDLQCYRKYGHNEQDETSFTQPILARLIKGKQSVHDRYQRQLLDEGVINQADLAAIELRMDEALEQAQREVKANPHDPTIDPGSSRWAGLRHKFSFDPGETAVSMETLKEVCEALGRVPDNFEVNRKLAPLLNARASLPETGEISYADAESLAYGTLLMEGYALRLSGQDCRRGTFSHRHAVLRDANTGEPYTPLNHIREMGVFGTDTPPGSVGADGRPRQAKFCVYDSPLSEASVLGFDYGYSLADPAMLVIWEAQFGDFANGAQAIIDQFVATAEVKWERWSGLVMLLPHGYEGAGPEHSSCRIERFLKGCGNNNMQVVYPSTAAQTFHMLRRQVKRSFRKPLIVATPKSMLRVPTSRIEELTKGHFEEIIDDPMFVGGADRSKVRQITLCCGKFYYDLAERRAALGREDVALIRIEQLYPFHFDLMKDVLGRYPDTAELVYAQEEPRNMGGGMYVTDQITAFLGVERPRYIGRMPSASPAVGSKRVHKSEQEHLITEAIGPKPLQDE
ncbi:MAG: 2-oxoglutarate dehydrogenase E1 component [Phycisphaeraceae bacterium]|nr:MAG: 2-oxoglutarate dehydrogenase E1 component [Phycisphaeraceae bacterium]